ncbi:MAG: hypothetical protein GY863_01695 [bacterium]|nr:hypothetical protein [bacterium]
MQTTGLITGLLIGLILGGFLGVKWHQNKLDKRKKEFRAKKKARQRKILEHMRIEVKNNTIRMKKEEKRLALSKELSNLELLFKNYKKRLFKVADKELLSNLQDFYQNLNELHSLNMSFIDLLSKGFSGGSINEQSMIDIKNSFAGLILNLIQVNIEKGSNLVTYIESTIDKT